MTCCNEQVHQGDVGTEFVILVTDCIDGVDVPVNLLEAISLQVVFRKPDNTTLIKAASYTSEASGGAGDGTDGLMSYVCVASDFDKLGRYRLQGIVTTGAGKWSSTIHQFNVEPNLLSGIS